MANKIEHLEKLPPLLPPKRSFAVFSFFEIFCRLLASLENTGFEMVGPHGLEPWTKGL